MATREQMAELEDDRTYRKRAKTDPLVVIEGEWHDKITQAVFWPNEGYGGHTLCNSREHALDAARSSLRLGYGRDSRKNTVRIVETRTRIIEVSLEDARARAACIGEGEAEG